MDFTFALDGDAVEEMCRAAERLLDNELRVAVQAASRLVRDEARRNHTYTDRTGDLTRSIALIPATGRATDGDLSGGVTATMRYASYVEDGTSRSRAFQYLGTAYLLNQSDIFRLWEDAVDNAIFRAGLGR